MGHYAIAQYAALAEAGIIPVEELETYGSDDSRLPMSGMATYTPGMEISGGSLGHGLGRRRRDGARAAPPGQPRPRLQHDERRRTRRRLHLGGGAWPSPTTAWATCSASSTSTRLQADGPTAGVLRTEPVIDKWQAFGWRTVRVDGNDINALVDAFDARARTGDTRGGHLRHPHRLAGCRSWKPGRRRTSSASTTTNGRPPATSSPQGHRTD